MSTMDSNAFKRLLQGWQATMQAHQQELIALDGLCGDSDLGLTMVAGFTAAAQAAQQSDEQDIGKLAYLAGKAMASAAPSTMGTLMASGLMNAGKALRGMQQLDLQGQEAMLTAYYEGVRMRGKAEPGDKTFLDGLLPALQALRQALAENAPPAQAAASAAQAAQQGYEATRGMAAKHGRMAIRAEGARDFLDPGARVAALLVKAWAEQVKDG